MAYHAFKRQREHEELADYSEDLIHEKKKHRALPLRTSPKTGQRFSFSQAGDIAPSIAISALTPVESSDDEVDLNKQFLSNSGHTSVQQPRIDSPAPPVALDTPMEIDACEDVQRTAKHVANSLLPASGSNRPDSHMMSAHAHRQNATYSATAMDHKGDFNSGIAPDSPWWRSPRLPSPVSESGDAMTSGKDTPSDADMTFNTSLPASPPTYRMGGDAADVEEQMSFLDLPDQRHRGPFSTPKTNKKPAFSMGYRTDCDKCRRRVPGHYSHIIRSG
ncbi:hypothetical protein P175DRAFT_0533580 [Aspergillus ochraceoroseus IBT 24754]|uniref:Uncharacterized protein n=1 Tax=Aspergillus ochraceoroseus IBT 24754 TaxID=1392256 RepID=A0A2T5LS95_9EURO|nr:uncharacterized protein P175DRAFT_0533580 [Aspergillus ochraceoroseus IBT 24754]PTU19160.1 hypothetical protein P175DRAFT_0533580 [Aspergillus ochraceoroseus IBT 24754]